MDFFSDLDHSFYTHCFEVWQLISFKELGDTYGGKLTLELGQVLEHSMTKA